MIKRFGTPAHGAAGAGDFHRRTLTRRATTDNVHGAMLERLTRNP